MKEKSKDVYIRPPGVFLVLCLFCMCIVFQESAIAATSPRPNILLVLADDLGFSDLGAYGSEISTPNIDRLANSGIRMTGMHVNTVCSQTRAMLLTGVDNHVAGFGTMAGDATEKQAGKPGYEMYLNNSVVTFVRLLQDAGYRTYMAGKWDMGGRGDPHLWPIRRGFHRSFALIEGSADHFEKLGAMTPVPVPTYVEDNREVDLPADFYSSKNYADKIIEYIETDSGPDSPFFAYLAFTAPHYPVQAPDEIISRYETSYKDGYRVIRKNRIRKQEKLGLLGKRIDAAARHSVWPGWNELSAETRQLETKRMQVYAAMVEAMDYHLGRVLDYLESEKILENTLVIFLSDNGPDGGNPLDWGWRQFVESTRDMSLENMGKKRSYVWMGPGWAHVSATPFKLSKGFMSEGGIVVPAIFTFPGNIAPGTINRSMETVLDIPLTILEFAGVSHPGSMYSGRPVHLPIGRSMTALLTGESSTLHTSEEAIGFEVYNRRAIIKGDWKITYSNQPWGKGRDWELYNLRKDPAELHDVSKLNPARFQAMKNDWDTYVRNNGVIIAPDFPLLWTNTLNHYEWRPGEYPEKRQVNAATPD